MPAIKSSLGVAYDLHSLQAICSNLNIKIVMSQFHRPCGYHGERNQFLYRKESEVAFPDLEDIVQFSLCKSRRAQILCPWHLQL